MRKYRIIEAKIPYQTLGDETNIKYEYRYHIEYLEVLLFGLIKRWEKCGTPFNSLAKAKGRIKFYNEQETWKVIKIENGTSLDKE